MQLESIPLRPGEEIQLFTHPHPASLSAILLGMVGAIAAISFLLAVSIRIGVLLAAGVIAVVALVFLWRAWKWWFGTLLVHTTERLIIIRQEGLFSSGSRDLPLQAIEQVDAGQVGVWSNLWGYGTLTLIMTSGERVIVTKVPRINEVAEGVRS